MMRRLTAIACCLVFLLIPAGAAWPGSPETIYQVSTLKALVEGVYEGNITFKELRRHGDFGIGTFNGLDGEMVGIDGKFYQVKANGYAYPVSDALKTPFSMVKTFRSEKAIYLEREYDYEDLTRYLDHVVASKNLPYAVKIEGLFNSVKTRSVPKQARPYAKLPEALKGQRVYEYSNVRGTIVGFRMPEYLKGVNTPGYHFHFISEDRKTGGHLLECETNDIIIYIDDIKEFRMVLPDSGEFLKTDLMKDSESGIFEY